MLVKVRAAALNFPDVLMAMGMYQEKPPLPYSPGVELCGEIVETGQRVIGSPSGGPGAFAEYALMDADNAWPVPDGHVRREGRLALPDLSDRVRRAAPPGEHPGGGLAARARRRRRRRDGGDPARQGRGREGDRHGGRRPQDRGLPRARRRPRHRLHGRGLRPDRQGGHRRARRRRDLRPGRRRRLRQVPQVHRLRGPDRRRRFHQRPHPRGAGQPPAGQELQRRRPALGAVPEVEPGDLRQVHERAEALVEAGAVDPLVGETLPLDKAPQALAKLGRPQHGRQGRARP